MKPPRTFGAPSTRHASARPLDSSKWMAWEAASWASSNRICVQVDRHEKVNGHNAKELKVHGMGGRQLGELIQDPRVCYRQADVKVHTALWMVQSDS